MKLDTSPEALAKKDRVAARHDYEVNLRTTIELLRLHREIDRISTRLGHMENGGHHSARRPLDPGLTP